MVDSERGTRGEEREIEREKKKRSGRCEVDLRKGLTKKKNKKKTQEK